MSDTALRVVGLGKSYRIRHEAMRYRTLRDDLVSLLPGHRQGRTSRETFWALRDVSFEVKTGEVLGVIGRNGAGKSTLLKILARITKPTTGYADIYGRVGSLLEVGTGFHAELTGRENIFLSGTILGMRRAEIQRRFDEIVDFAEVEQFLDTPVKRYSSGMYMRLAFAVAAHLDPEVLIVDEVLAVGDAAFQKKSLGKMGDVAKSGRTVLFVSHNMSAIESLCSRAILLRQGQIAHQGATTEVVTQYLSEQQDESGMLSSAPRQGNRALVLTDFWLEDAHGQVTANGRSGEPAIFAFSYHNRELRPADRVSVGFSVATHTQVPLFYYYSHFSNVTFSDLPERGVFRCLLPDLPLSAGTYWVGCRVVMNGDHLSGETVDYPQVQLPLVVNTVDYFGTGDVNIPNWGPIVVRGQWSEAPMMAGVGKG